MWGIEKSKGLRRSFLVPRIVLTEQQHQIFRDAEVAIEICDPSGNVLGNLEHDLRPETDEEARRRIEASARGVPSSEIEALLLALEKEWKRTGGFNKEHLNAFME